MTSISPPPNFSHVLPCSFHSAIHLLHSWMMTPFFFYRLPPEVTSFLVHVLEPDAGPVPYSTLVISNVELYLRHLIPFRRIHLYFST